MSETKPVEATKGKGAKFFDRADQVAETGNWDFAIEMYTEGIRREPDAVERGHRPLREVALRRKAAGGKGPGMMEKLKAKPGKDPLENLIKAERLLSKEPGSLLFMEQVLQAARALEATETLGWIADVILHHQQQNKPSRRVLFETAKACEEVEQYKKGLAVADLARGAFPDNGEIENLAKTLAANSTLQQRGGEEEDFTKHVRDMDKQVELAQSDQMVQSESIVEKQIERARAEYLADPTIGGKVDAVVDALVKTEDEAFENEAIDILRKAHTDIGAYRFKMRIGDIRIKQMTRRYRELLSEGDKAAAAEQAKRQLEFELEEYGERAVNYPTDLRIKFELGRRQLIAGQLDEAIASLQQAQRDPRRHAQALNYLGQAFAKKGWLREAAETYERALDAELPEARVKELRYNLGDVLEQMDELDRAQDEFSAVAQIDYNYKDVRDRLEGIRQKQDNA